MYPVSICQQVFIKIIKYLVQDVNWARTALVHASACDLTRKIDVSVLILWPITPLLKGIVKNTQKNNWSRAEKFKYNFSLKTMLSLPLWN